MFVGAFFDCSLNAEQAAAAVSNPLVSAHSCATLYHDIIDIMNARYLTMADTNSQFASRSNSNNRHQTRICLPITVRRVSIRLPAISGERGGSKKKKNNLNTVKLTYYYLSQLASVNSFSKSFRINACIERTQTMKKNKMNIDIHRETCWS